MTRIYYVCQEIRTTNQSKAIQAGDLRGAPVYMDVYNNDDPVLSGRHLYEDGGWTWIGPAPARPLPADPTQTDTPPECEQNCKWRQTFHADRQNNALRCELVHMVEPYRCGWNIKPGCMGGHPMDYAPCHFQTSSKQG